MRRRPHGTISSLLSMTVWRSRIINVVNCHATVLCVLLAQLFVGRVRILEDDIPSVQQAWQDTETAESEVDQRVCAADAALDPD